MRSAGPPILVAALSFAYFLSYPLVIGRADESHLLHGARRVLDGQVLYRDFFEIITPLGFYFFAAVYWLGGTTLQAARVGTALVGALGCAALFVLARQVASTAEALLAAVILAALCFPVWPFASAHWMSTTLGLLAAMAGLADRWRDSSRLRPAAAGVLCGAAICVQQQRGVFLLLWLVLATPVLALSRQRGQRWRTAVRESVWSCGAAAIVVLIVLGHAAWAASPALLIDAVYGFAVESYGPQHVGHVTWAGVWLLTQVYLPYTWLWLLRVSPLLLLGEGATLLRHARPPWSRPVLVRSCLWLLGTLMALSIWYLPDFIHVAFVLPFMLVPGARLLHGLRSWGGWSRVPAGRQMATAGLVAAILMVSAKGVTNLVYARSRVSARFTTGFGTLEGDAYVEGLLGAVRRHLVPEPEGRSLVYSYPIDAWLYLALPADDATRFDILSVSFPQRYVDEVLTALRARRPGTVVLLSVASAPAIEEAVAQGYDLAEEYPPYRIYVRRGSRAAG